MLIVFCISTAHEMPILEDTALCASTLNHSRWALLLGISVLEDSWTHEYEQS